MAAPVSPQILHDFHSDNTYYRTLIISIWELGETFGPLILGPLSEIHGRAVVLNCSNALFVIFFVGTALSTNIQMLIAFRFLTGATVASSCIGPGIVGDIFLKEERGRAMSLVSITAALGPAVGPIIGSYLGDAAGWRWAFWLPTILQGSVSLVFFFVYRETYKVTILRRKTRRLEKATGVPQRDRYTTHEMAFRRLGFGIIRPVRLLATSPVFIILTIYLSLNNGFVYLILTSLAPLVTEIYGFSEGVSGLAFLGLCIGILFGSLSCSVMLDYYVRRVAARAGQSSIQPELRLPPVVLAGLLMPIGLFIFGWTAEARVHWIAPIIASGIIGFAFVATSISLKSYVIDAFGIYGVSALSAALMLRNLTGAFFPLAGPPLISNLGYGWGLSLLGFISLAFIPMSLLWMKLGHRLRSMGVHETVE